VNRSGKWGVTPTNGGAHAAKGLGGSALVVCALDTNTHDTGQWRKTCSRLASAMMAGEGGDGQTCRRPESSSSRQSANIWNHQKGPKPCKESVADWRLATLLSDTLAIVDWHDHGLVARQLIDDDDSACCLEHDDGVMNDDDDAMISFMEAFALSRVYKDKVICRTPRDRAAVYAWADARSIRARVPYIYSAFRGDRLFRYGECRQVTYHDMLV